MPVTRDPGYPAERAELFQAFNRAADGYDMAAVLDTALNFTIAAIRNYGNARGINNEQLEAFARANADAIVKKVIALQTRKQQPDDVLVAGRGN